MLERYVEDVRLDGRDGVRGKSELFARLKRRYSVHDVLRVELQYRSAKDGKEKNRNEKDMALHGRVVQGRLIETGMKSSLKRELTHLIRGSVLDNLSA